MKTKRTIEINGEACKVLSIERKDYNEPVDRESGTAGQRSFISYAITVRRHILRVKYPDGAEKQITIDPIIPDRPDDFEPLKILSLPADPALPKGISRIYCDKRFFCADVKITDAETTKADPMATAANKIEQAAKNLVPVMEGFEKATLANTPPQKRTWWKNARAAYNSEADNQLEKDKWLAVTKRVITGAIEANIKKPADKQTDYLTPRMMKTLLKKLNAPGASRSQVEAHYADKFRRDVSKAEGIAKKK